MEEVLPVGACECSEWGKSGVGKPLPPEGYVNETILGPSIPEASRNSQKKSYDYFGKGLYLPSSSTVTGNGMLNVCPRWLCFWPDSMFRKVIGTCGSR